MKKNIMLGKFMARNINAISAYTAAMAIIIILFPFIFKKLELTVQLGSMALVTTLFLAYLNYQQAQDKMFKDLFKEFNERYSKFNDEYKNLKDNYKADIEFKSITDKDVKFIIDYLNLCAEEYFWFERGRIDLSAWQSWESGMQTWAALPVVQKVFVEEMATWTTSYYSGFIEYFAKANK